MNLKGKKELIIVIPGVKFVGSVVNMLQKATLTFYKFTHIHDPAYFNYGAYYADILDNHSREAIWLHWGRGITPISKWLAVKRLNGIIKEYRKNYKIKIVGISLGGEVALEAGKKWDDGSIDRIILISPTIENIFVKFNKIKVFNLYSDYDLFAKISARVLSPFRGGIIGKNISNLEIPNFGHDAFCADKKIEYGKFKGKRISQVITKLLKV